MIKLVSEQYVMTDMMDWIDSVKDNTPVTCYTVWEWSTTRNNKQNTTETSHQDSQGSDSQGNSQCLRIKLRNIT